MLSKFSDALWGELSKEELKKFSFLAVIIMIILGNYWMLRSLKNPIFNDLVGMEFQPYAKMASMVVVAFIISIYSKLVDVLQKHTLFLIICTCYSLIFLFLGLATTYPQLFSLQISSSLYPLFAWIPGKAIGWLTYFSFESSSLLMIVFWAFVASNTKTESAKKGYALIITCIQIGTILGPAMVTNLAPKIGSPTLVAFGGLLILTIPFLIKIYMRVIPPLEETPDSAAQKKEEESKKTGLFEGLRLIVTRPYVMCILIVSTIYEVIGTILEFQMNMMAKEIFPSRDLFAAFAGKYGMSINGVTFAFALIGTSFFMRKFGLRFCLIVFPVIIGFVLLGLLGINAIGASQKEIMWSLFASMVMLKGLSYALNNPTKEVMYIPTTKDVKFKAKGWIESFGGRASKGSGAVVTAAFARNVPALLFAGTIISLGIVGIWIIVANILGKQFNKLQETNTVVK